MMPTEREIEAAVGNLKALIRNDAETRSERVILRAFEDRGEALKILRRRLGLRDRLIVLLGRERDILRERLNVMTDAYNEEAAEFDG